jgi:hypothetical protein
MDGAAAYVDSFVNTRIFSANSPWTNGDFFGAIEVLVSGRLPPGPWEPR